MNTKKITIVFVGAGILVLLWATWSVMFSKEKISPPLTSEERLSLLEGLGTPTESGTSADRLEALKKMNEGDEVGFTAEERLLLLEQQ